MSTPSVTNNNVSNSSSNVLTLMKGTENFDIKSLFFNCDRHQITKVTGNFELEYEHVFLITALFNNITSFDLPFNSWNSHGNSFHNEDTTYWALSERYPNLTHLKFDAKIEYAKELAGRIFKNCPYLTSLSFDGHSVGNKQYTWFYNKQLRTIELLGLGQFKNEDMQALATYCPSLTELRLRISYSRSLDKGNCNDEGLKFLAQKCRSLNYIHLSGFLEVTEVSMKALAEIGVKIEAEHCRRLAEQVSSNSNVTENSFVGQSPIIKQSAPSIQENPKRPLSINTQEPEELENSQSSDSDHNSPQNIIVPPKKKSNKPDKIENKASSYSESMDFDRWRRDIQMREEEQGYPDFH